MTLAFNSFAELALHLAEAHVHMAHQLTRGLDRAAAVIQRRAKGEIGNYQPAVGPFQEWAPLAESTLEQKEAGGYSPPDNPLLRTGGMRASIEREVHGTEAIVGTKDPTLVFHEFGTAKMPARPVLGPAAVRSKDDVQKIIGAAMLSGLIGGAPVHPSLGYDFDTTP
ncbi:MAG: hypothetical protein GC190_21910 [Alphaproteobacteria bacterium]|nr:hypothetical protein [Alphaproteobacteria bacterium]